MRNAHYRSTFRRVFDKYVKDGEFTEDMRRELQNAGLNPTECLHRFQQEMQGEQYL